MPNNRAAGTRTRARLFNLVSLLVALWATASAAQAPLGPAKTDSPVTLEQGAGYLLLDLTRQDDKTAPAIRVAYQSFVGDAVRRLRAANPESDIRLVPYYSIAVVGTPSNGVANLFSDGRISAGGDVQLSIGQAYLLSTATPRNVSVTGGNLAMLAVAADSIERLKEAIAAEQDRPQQDDLRIDALQRNLDSTWTPQVQNLRRALVRRRDATKLTAYRLMYDEAIAYADEILAFTRPDALVKPTRPDAASQFRSRGGPIYDAWFMRAGLNAGSATLLDTSAPFDQQFTTKEYRGYSLQAGYSIRMGGRLPMIAAASGGVRRSSNVDELSSTEVTETQTLTSPDGTTRRVITGKRSGLVGSLEEQTRSTAKLDLVFFPGLMNALADPASLRSSVAIDLFARVEGDTRTMYGVGAYLTKPGSPTSVYGGLNLYRSQERTLAVDIVAGFPF